MTWLDKWIFDTPYYDKLLHAGGCGSLVLVEWFFTYSLLWSAMIAVSAGVAKELIDCWNIAEFYNRAYGDPEPLPKEARSKWYWHWDWWDILADIIGIGLAVGLIWWRG